MNMKMTKTMGSVRFNQKKTGLVRTLDNQISTQYLRIDTIFPESQLKKDMFFPDRLVERSIIFQTTENH